MIIRFDSRRVNPAPAGFGFGVDPADWDALAEDAANLDAVCNGFLPF